MSEAEQNARLREALAWCLTELYGLKQYMKRPENGDHGSECAVCMGEWFEPEDLIQMDNARQFLNAR